MAKRQSGTQAEVRDPSGQAGQRGGSSSKGRLHDGVMGSGEARDLGNSKFNKESRDSVSEKEAGKSRGRSG